MKETSNQNTKQKRKEEERKMNTIDEGKFKEYLGQVRTPRADSRVLKDECVFSFEGPVRIFNNNFSLLIQTIISQ